MPFPSSRIPNPSKRSSKSSFLLPPTVSLSASNSEVARTVKTPSPGFKRPTKRLQFSVSVSNKTPEKETQKKAQVSSTILRPISAASSFVSSSCSDTQSENIRVLLRIRPSSSRDKKKAVEVAPDHRGVTLAPSSQQEKRFGFDRVFIETCDQDEIFQDVGRVAVDNTIQGYNGSIFAYGQTGSGKSFTMLGGPMVAGQDLRHSPLRGLTPRILDYLFLRLAALAKERNTAFYDGQEQERALQYTLACSYLEIYNEKVFDLLEPSGSVAAQQPKNLREDRNKEVYVDQLREIDVGSEQEALTLLQLGAQNRHISSTEMNRESSRSHTVFSVKLVVEERTSAGVKRTRRSRLHLVDLAGSEKQRQTRVQGKRLKEAAQINKSLSALGNVIMALVDVSNGQKRHVHYRDSKLTYLLRDALGGNAITSIVATISPEETYFTETLSTLKFAQRAKFIKNNAVQNEDSDSLVPVLKEQIEKLMREIAVLRSDGRISGSAPCDDVPNVEPSNVVHVNGFAEAETKSQVNDKKQNRWEPALDIMQKLLRASGAWPPMDGGELNEENSQQLERDVVEVRCDRLEMLLYRMICRFEEYKEVTFDPHRLKYDRRSQQLKPSRLPAPRMSKLPVPKRYSGATVRYHQIENQEHSADDEGIKGKRECEIHRKLQEQENQIRELSQRSQEAEAENDLIRQELCELLEWKAFVEEERRRASDGVPIDPQLESEDDELETPILEASTVPSEEMQEMQELLNVYRSLYDEVTELMYTKRPMLCIPPSPKSGSSVVTDSASTCYASGDEEEIGDDCISVDGFDASEDGDVGASDTYREIRRVNALSLRLERQLDYYQDAIQRLEKELQTSQDELETSSAATKFAEFQLQQLRSLAADEESKQIYKLQARLKDVKQRVRSQHEEIAQILDKEAAEDGKALHHEQFRIKRLETSSSFEEGRSDNEELASALEKAQRHIKELEQEILDTPEVAMTTTKVTSEEASLQLLTLLDQVLKDNSKLLTAVRALQSKRFHDGVHCQLSSPVPAVATGCGKQFDSAGEDRKADQFTPLRQEISSLQSQRDLDYNTVTADADLCDHIAPDQ